MKYEAKHDLMCLAWKYELFLDNMWIMWEFHGEIPFGGNIMYVMIYGFK